MTRMPQRGRGAVRGWVILAAVAGAGCGDSGPGEEPGASAPIPEEDRFGGTIVIAGSASPTTFNPAAATDELSYQLQRHVVLMTLLRPDENLEPVPYLAESWELNGDSTEIVFHLRDDVRWHDGQPTTAADVAYTFNLLKNPDAGFPNAEWFEGWEGAELVDRRSIRFAVRPRAGLLSGWTRLPIMPQHLMSDAAPGNVATHPFGAAPTGNGPFRFVEARGGDQWIFEANPDFPEALARPYASRLVYRTIPDATAQLAELRTGGVHYVRFISPSQLETARADRSLRVVEFPSRAYGLIAWNGTRPMFQDARVRTAFTMAIDRQAIVDAVRYGLGEVANGPIGPWHPAYDRSLAPLPFAPDSARALLASAGWVDADGDGVRERGGRPLGFELLTNENAAYRDIAQIVQARLAVVGAKVRLRVVESSTLGDAIMSPERRFDAFVLEWESDLDVDDRQLFSCQSVGEIFQFSSYCNRALDPILDSIPNARSSEQGARLLREYVRIVRADQPFSFLYFARDASAMTASLGGVTLDMRGDLGGVTRWWLDPAVRDGGPS